MTTPKLSAGDRVVLAAANLWLVLRHPRIAARFWVRGHGLPCFATPRTHGQLVQWRKLFDHNPLFVTLTDKLTAKDWARTRGVESVRVTWRGTRGEDIPAELLTDDCVVKLNHGTAANTFPGREALNARVNGQLRQSWATYGQWAYGLVEPQIFVEDMVTAEPLWEMTFRCHDGEIASWYIARDQKTPREQNAFYDAADRRLHDPVGWIESENLPRDFVPPAFVAEAKAVARRLSAGLDYARVDLIWDGRQVVLGEMTIYPSSGFGPESRARIAPLIESAWFKKLHLSWFLSTPQPWPKSVYAAALKKWLAARKGA